MKLVIAWGGELGVTDGEDGGLSGSMLGDPDGVDVVPAVG
jgi:hypothetical protein